MSEEERKTVRLEELVASLMWQMAAITVLLERRNLMSREEILREVEHLRNSTG